MACWGIIGGSGLTRIAGLETLAQGSADTPWGRSSAPPLRGRLSGREVLFLARHGDPHVLPPHRINYRANLWALKEAGACAIVAVAAVGTMRADMLPGCLIVPDQIIDYTWGRAHTYFEDDLAAVTHVDFTWPYDRRLRAMLLQAATAAGVAAIDGGCYGATQGPRLESAAEIRRLERDGCDLVGMTGMPEAALARELGLAYACLAVSANWAAGKTDSEITIEEIEANLSVGMDAAVAVLHALLGHEPPAVGDG